MCMNECKKAFERFFRKSIGLSRFLPLTLIALLITATAASAQHPNHPVCQKIANHQLQVSAGAQMFCFGPQPNGPARPLVKVPSPSSSIPSPGSGDSFGTTNVNAANLSEDQNNGTRAYGQSETSIAAAGSYVVEEWNDATGFFAPPCSPNYKDQLSGFAFSSDGGKTFTDMGGLPNINCATSVFEGDPSVEVYQTGGNTYFYLSSLFFDTSNFAVKIAMDVCQVTGSTLTCNLTPVIIADPGLFGFDDKDFMSIDATRGLLYATYTDFSTGDVISLSVCDIGNGALGGTPSRPVCNSTTGPTPRYLAVAASGAPDFCEIEGAYPSVDRATGDVYVGYEFNWFTNTFAPCNSNPVQDVLAWVPATCITLPGPTSCAGPAATAAVDIVSTDTTFIAGYNRGTGNDFPRLAVSGVNGTVSMVWNDTRSNPLADVLLQSFDLVSLTPVQTAPVKLNNDSASGTLHFLPALRNADANGNLNVSWYDRRLSPSSALTDVFAALGVNPRTTGTPKFNTRVTNVSSNWLVVSSDITPNFGDYTDNYIVSASGKGLTARIFAAWSDGRANDPQPFCAHQGLK
jgi:hypothetical protein